MADRTKTNQKQLKLEAFRSLKALMCGLLVIACSSCNQPDAGPSRESETASPTAGELASGDVESAENDAAAHGDIPGDENGEVFATDTRPTEGIVPPVVSAAAPPVKLWIRGIRYPKTTATQTEFLRFRDVIYKSSSVTTGIEPKKARTTTGGSLVFKTKSPNVRLSFEFVAGQENRGSVFAVRQNGGASQYFSVAADALSYNLELHSNFAAGTLVTYRVILPHYSNPILREIKPDLGHVLQEFTPPTRSPYIAIGDSISHGAGQKGTFETYPWLVSEGLNLELYSLAVGGSKISVKAAEGLADWTNIRAITILIGFNDWRTGKSIAQLKTDYGSLLNKIRSLHPNVPVFCLSLLYSTNTSTNSSGATLADARVAINNVVQSRINAGDSNLKLVDTTGWIHDADLYDAVHLNATGARKVATQLRARMSIDLGI